MYKNKGICYRTLKFFFKIYHYVQVCLLRSVAFIFSKRLSACDWDRVLIVSPHPDDEVFGCAGLINLLVQKQKRVDLIILSKGEAVHRSCCPGDDDYIVSKRRSLTDEANEILGLRRSHIYRLDFPDDNFTAVDNPQLFMLEQLIEDLNPNIVFIPHPYENSPDHVAATGILERILKKKSIPIHCYCVWTWYHMPIYKILKLKYKHARLLRVENRELKNKAIDVYINNSAKCGISYSGDLPKPFIYAFRWKYELFFEA